MFSQSIDNFTIYLRSYKYPFKNYFGEAFFDWDIAYTNIYVR